MDKTIFALGVFDLIHEGHVILLERAAEYGDLIVGVVNDRAVKEQKGIHRPIVNEEQRMYMVSKLKCVKKVELVCGFYIPHWYILNADLIVVGGDQDHIQNLKEIPESKRLDIPRTEGISTGDIIKKIKGE